MIVVRNTVELEKYGLDNIKDDEQVRIVGGMLNKTKYNNENYIRRTTYTGRQIKQIINQMKLIENSIPSNWNAWQRAKYIYEILGKNIGYDYDATNYITGQASNLSIILSKKAICAGYSLLYKEMMDRQGIECDYIRGIGIGQNRSEKHAWNVLTIDNYSFPIDLTWDSGRLIRGENQIVYFGNSQDFNKNHMADQDEKQYKLVRLKNEFVNSIDINSKDINNEISEEEKMRIVKFAIEETYKKNKLNYGREIAENQIKKAIYTYINQSMPKGFTRNSNAREQIVKNVTSEDMLDIMVKSYIEEIKNNNITSIIDDSVNTTLKKYGLNQAIEAIGKLLKTGQASGFTRENGARDNIKGIEIEKIMNYVIDKVANEEIEQIEIREQNDKTVLVDQTTKYFSSNEFEKIELEQNNAKTLLSESINWIKNRSRIINSEKNNTMNNVRMQNKKNDKERN